MVIARCRHRCQGCSLPSFQPRTPAFRANYVENPMRPLAPCCLRKLLPRTQRVHARQHITAAARRRIPRLGRARPTVRRSGCRAGHRSFYSVGASSTWLPAADLRRAVQAPVEGSKDNTSPWQRWRQPVTFVPNAAALQWTDRRGFDASNTAQCRGGFNDLAIGKRCASSTSARQCGGQGRARWRIRQRSASPTAHDRRRDRVQRYQVLADARVWSPAWCLWSGEKYGFALRLTPAGQLDPTFNAAGISGAPACSTRHPSGRDD